MGSAGPQFDIFSDYQNTIDGRLSTTKTTRHGINPATGKPNPEVPVSTQEDVDNAVAAGLKAFESWKKTTWAERRKAVSAFADALEKHKDDFAKLLTQEQGKPVCCYYFSLSSHLSSPSLPPFVSIPAIPLFPPPLVRLLCSDISRHNLLRAKLRPASPGCARSLTWSSRRRSSRRTTRRRPFSATHRSVSSLASSPGTSQSTWLAARLVLRFLPVILSSSSPAPSHLTATSN
jgi:hypothetical protein